MNYINILIGLVILLILSKIIRNTAEYFKCPNDNDALNKFVRHSFEKRRDSLIKEREDITKTKMDFLESERNTSEATKGVTVNIPVHDLEESISGICILNHSV